METIRLETEDGTLIEEFEISDEEFDLWKTSAEKLGLTMEEFLDRALSLLIELNTPEQE